MSRDESLKRKVLLEMQMLDGVSFQEIKKEVYAGKFAFETFADRRPASSVFNDLRAELDELNLCVKRRLL